jgi:K+-sensing histidine kinase KdpD
MDINGNSLLIKKTRPINHQSMIENRQFDLRYLISNFCIKLGIDLVRKGFDLSITISPMMPRYFKGDPVRINDLLINIIHCSLNYLNEGGIAINVESEPIDPHTHRVCFMISVSGQSLPAPMLNTIFHSCKERLSRGIVHQKPNLYIAKIIADIMGGEISITSPLGFGNRYTATINLGVVADQLMN